MADEDKITALTELTDPVVADLLAIIDDPSGSAATKKVTLQKILDLFSGVMGGWTDYNPAVTGYSSNPTNTVYHYIKIGKMVILQIREATAGTSNSVNTGIELPFACVTKTNYTVWGTALVTDNNVILLGSFTLSSGGTEVTFRTTSTAAGDFTASGNKKVNSCTFIYECA